MATQTKSELERLRDEVVQLRARVATLEFRRRVDRGERSRECRHVFTPVVNQDGVEVERCCYCKLLKGTWEWME